MQYGIMLYNVMQCHVICTIMYYVVLSNTMFYCIKSAIQYDTMLYDVVPCNVICTIMYYVALSNTMYYYIESAIQYDIMLYNVMPWNVICIIMYYMGNLWLLRDYCVVTRIMQYNTKHVVLCNTVC